MEKVEMIRVANKSEEEKQQYVSIKLKKKTERQCMSLAIQKYYESTRLAYWV